jgi:TolA-binding protein
MIRAWAAVLAMAVGSAPMQCSSKPDPNNRLEDTAGDALWALGEKFEKEHNDAAAKETWQYLVEKYPSSRYTPAAKEKLGLK